MHVVFLWKLNEKIRSIIGDRLRKHLNVTEGLAAVRPIEKRIRKRLGFLFGYILITTAPITTVLMSTERGKNWVFFGICVRIYKIELRFYRKV